jgi:deoxycytidylate deaminase
MRDPGLDIFDKAIALAKKSTMQQKHGAIVVYNGEILGQGFNHMASFMSHSWSCHAEMGAILSIRKKDKWKICESTLVVVRVGSDNDVKLSKPCANCTREIEKYGIKKIFFST